MFKKSDFGQVKFNQSGSHQQPQFQQANFNTYSQNQSSLSFIDLKFLKPKFEIKFMSHPGAQIAKTEVKPNNFWKYITGVVVTATGLLLYLTPLGPIAGAALTSAGLSGILKVYQDPNISWNQFATEMGINAVIGAVIGGIASGADKIKILNDSTFQAAIKGAIIGAVTSSVSELIRLGIDPNKKGFSWSKVLIGMAIGSLSGAAKHYFAQKQGLIDKQSKQITNEQLNKALAQISPEDKLQMVKQLDLDQIKGIFEKLQLDNLLKAKLTLQQAQEELKLILDSINSSDLTSCAITASLLSALSKTPMQFIQPSHYSVSTVMNLLAKDNSIVSLGFSVKGGDATDHFLTVFKLGGTINVAQSWQGVFSLTDWVTKTNFNTMSLEDFGQQLAQVMNGNNELFHGGIFPIEDVVVTRFKQIAFGSL